MIFSVVVREFLKGGQEYGKHKISENIKPDIVKYAVIFEQRCKEGAKDIIHLEAFLARVMALYRNS